MKKRENLQKIPTKGDVLVNILRPPPLLLEFGSKITKARIHTDASNCKYECDWLIYDATLNVIGLLNCPMTDCPITTWQVNYR